MKDGGLNNARSKWIFINDSLCFILSCYIIFWSFYTPEKAVAIKNSAKVANVGFVITIIGCMFQITSFIFRWIVGGYAPVSNMYEFTTFFGLMFIIAFIILFFIYRLSVIGMFTLPLVVLMIGFASMFSRDITPLAPSLKVTFTNSCNVVCIRAGNFSC